MDNEEWHEESMQRAMATNLCIEIEEDLDENIQRVKDVSHFHRIGFSLWIISHE
jgi:hypothetical protein